MPSKATELRELPDEELLARIDSAKEELFNLRFQLATGQLDNPTRLKEVRHEAARVVERADGPEKSTLRRVTGC